jgi:hypothetical protein
MKTQLVQLEHIMMYSNTPKAQPRCTTLVAFGIRSKQRLLCPMCTSFQKWRELLALAPMQIDDQEVEALVQKTPLTAQAVSPHARRSSSRHASAHMC